MNMKYFKIKHIALLLAVTSAPLYTACDFMIAAKQIIIQSNKFWITWTV